MKLTLVINPAASSVTSRAREVIERAVSHGHDVRIIETNERGHATLIARAAANDGHDAVIVLSGDGTLNEVANGLVGTDTALAALPGGSTNVFARAIGMTNDPLEATGILLDLLANNTPEAMSLGSANGRYFLQNVGVGYDAAVVARTERRGWLKRYMGQSFFWLTAVFTWARATSRPSPAFTVSYRGKSIPSYLVLALNQNPYTYAGVLPFDVAPNADYRKGFALASIRSLAFPTMVGVLLSTFSRNLRLSDHRKVDFATEVEEIIVRDHTPFPYQVDGDYVDAVTELTLRHHPQLLRVFTAR